MPPRNVIALDDSHQRAPAGVAVPDTIRISTVPPTGMAAVQPGNGVAAVNMRAEPAIRPMPAQPRTVAIQPSRVRSTRTRATSAPAANSQTRAGVTKYAMDGASAVTAMEYAREAIPTTDRPTMRIDRGDVALPFERASFGT